MEGAVIHLSQTHYSRYPSPDSIPAYHPAYGYLSPPYSSTRSPPTEAIFAASPAGLGITHCRYEAQHEQRNLYTASSEQMIPSFKTELDPSATEGAVMPAQYAPQLPYPSSTGYPSYYSTPQHHYAPIHQTPSLLVQHIGNRTGGQASYLDPPTHSAKRVPDAANLRYQPDPMHHGKWVVTAQEVIYTMPETQPDTVTWERHGLQQYPYPDQYMIQYASDESGTTTKSRSSTLSTPATSQGGTPLQNTDAYLQPLPDDYLNTPKIETFKTEAVSPSMVSAATSVRSVSKSPAKNRRTTKQAHTRSRRCRHCPETFPNLPKLREHEKLHDSMPAVCPEPGCTLVYSRNADLNRHHKSKHEHYSFPCKYCSKKFNRTDITKRHEEQSCRVRKAEEASQGARKHHYLQTRD